MMPRRVFPVTRAQWLGALIIVGIALFTGALMYRMFLGAEKDERLCQVLHSMIAQSGATLGKPGTPGFAYYQDHPEELETARRLNDDRLAELPCDH